jgi:hypothetical protein
MGCDRATQFMARKQCKEWSRKGRQAKADLAAQADQKRYARKQIEGELYEITAQRLSKRLRINNSGVKPTAHHKAKQIVATPGTPSRNGDVLVQGNDDELRDKADLSMRGLAKRIDIAVQEAVAFLFQQKEDPGVLAAGLRKFPKWAKPRNHGNVSGTRLFDRV